MARRQALAAAPAGAGHHVRDLSVARAGCPGAGALVLTIDLYNGLLFLCLVPSTVQSSIAFTSIARGQVSAATRQRVAVQHPRRGADPAAGRAADEHQRRARMDATAIRDIVLQLLLPFGAGQLMRPLIADWSPGMRC